MTDLLNRALDFFDDAGANKFIRGKEEHGGDLETKSALQLVDEAMNETIDLFFYLYTLREKLSGGADSG